jgi:glutamate-1-semialdehyde 2,1-aminomutase
MRTIRRAHRADARRDGCLPADRSFLHALRDATHSLGVPLIFDEVMSLRLAPGGL